MLLHLSILLILLVQPCRTWHHVELRTGVIDWWVCVRGVVLRPVAGITWFLWTTDRDQLLPGSSSSRRNLGGADSRVVPRNSPLWGPLADQQLFVLSFGPEDASCDPVEEDTIRSTSWGDGIAEAERHASTLSTLHAHGGVLLSSLTSSAWMILASVEAAKDIMSTLGICMVRGSYLSSILCPPDHHEPLM